MNAQYLHLDAQFVKAEIAKLIASYPDLAEDESLRLDMIEGETDAVKVVDRLLSEHREAEAMAAAIKIREGEIFSRRGRYERKAEAMKGMIKAIMQAAQIAKLPLPEATISITKPRTKVEVHSVDDLPQGYFTTTRKPETAAIKDALEKGEEIPGAYLVTGDAGLTIRTK